MNIEDLLKKMNLTKYRLSIESGVPHATLSDIMSGKTRMNIFITIYCCLLYTSDAADE